MRFRRTLTVAAAATLSVTAFIWGTTNRVAPEAVESVIIQAASLEQAAAAVEAVGGEITHELRIIDAVGAQLTTQQRSDLGSGVRSYENAPVEAAALATGDTRLDTYITDTFSSTDDAFFPKQTDADQLHDQYIDGRGIGIAVVDTGIWGTLGGLAFDPVGDVRVPAAYDAINNRLTRHKRNQNSLAGDFNMDGSGHGSHISSVAVNSTPLPSGDFAGIAPAATLVPVKAFNSNGQGTYADVIRGLDWVYSNASRYKIRVVNLSFSATAQSHYWDDPINQAVMELWRSNLVVVASAGNAGPDPMTIGVPGNLPTSSRWGRRPIATRPTTPVTIG